MFWYYFHKLPARQAVAFSLSLKKLELEFIENNDDKSTSYRASVFSEELGGEMATWSKCLAEAPRMQ